MRRRRRFILPALAAVALAAAWAHSCSTGGGPAARPPAKARPDSAKASAAPGLRVVNKSYPPGIEVLGGTAGKQAEGELKVLVLRDGVPVPGVTVAFRIVSQPDRSRPAAVKPVEAVTGAKGLARASLRLSPVAGTHVIRAVARSGGEEAEAVVTAEGRRKGWVFFLLVGLLGGLGLFVFGMDLASDAIQRATGGRMRTMVEKVSGSSLTGLAVGVGVTTLTQSSSATTVMLVGLVGATMMTLAQSIPVILGAKVGTTVALQLIAFNLGEVSPLFIVLGLVIKMAARRKGYRRAGEIIMGFGLIFMGMSFMSSAMKPLRTMSGFMALLTGFAHTPALSMLVAAVFTFVIQASAGTIGILMVMMSQGILGIADAFPMALGANIGTSATALLGSVGAKREGKQVAVAYLVVSIVGSLLMLPFSGPFTGLVERLSLWVGCTSPARVMANAYMLFNMIMAPVLLAGRKPIERLTLALLPPLPGERPFGPVYLQETSLNVPELAIEQAKKETLRMAEIIGEMLRSLSRLIQTPDERESKAVEEQESRLDILQEAIRSFLVKVAAQDIGQKLSRKEHGLLYIVNDFENIGDVLKKEVLSSIRKLREGELRLSDQGAADLRTYFEKMIEKHATVCEALRRSKDRLAEQVVQLSFKEAQLEKKLKREHIERLHSGLKETAETSALHMGILGGLSSVSSLLLDIAYVILEEMVDG